ncbi:MAG: hypothetical protein V3S31_02355 [Dehalococcoidia bacterium]
MPPRKVPRPFKMHWGTGEIVEEASFEGEHTAPTIQLMRFDDGSLTIRFCHFNHRGNFQRSPMMLSEQEVGAMREAVSQTPELLRLLQRIAGR